MAEQRGDVQSVSIEDTGRRSSGPIKFLRIRTFVEISSLTGIIASSTEYIEVLKPDGSIVRRATNNDQVNAAMMSLDMKGYMDASDRIWKFHVASLIMAKWNTDDIAACKHAYDFFVNEVILSWRQFGRDCGLALDERIREIVASEEENPETPGRQCFRWGMRFMNIALNLKQSFNVTNHSGPNSGAIIDDPNRARPSPNPNPTIPQAITFHKANGNGKAGYNKAAKTHMHKNSICCFYNTKTCREPDTHGKWKHICGQCGGKHPAIECPQTPAK